METQEQYVRGFNHGYLLTKHVPDLVGKLTASLKASTNDYLSGFFSGKEEYELELKQERLDELDQIRRKANDREHDRGLDS